MNSHTSCSGGTSFRPTVAAQSPSGKRFKPPSLLVPHQAKSKAMAQFLLSPWQQQL